MSKRLCNEDCNNCTILNSENYAQLSKIMNECYIVFGSDFYDIVQQNCPCMTYCAECNSDDFTHVENCTLIGGIEI